MKRKRAHPDWMRPNLLNKIGVCSRLFKWFNQLTQVVQSAYSSGSISLLKWFNQLTQVAQSDYSSDSISEFSRLRNPVQSNP